MKKSAGRGVFHQAWLLAATVLLQACGDTTLAEPSSAEAPARVMSALETVADSEDILARLQSIPGLTVLDERPRPTRALASSGWCSSNPRTTGVPWGSASSSG